MFLSREHERVTAIVIFIFNRKIFTAKKKRLNGRYPRDEREIKGKRKGKEAEGRAVEIGRESCERRDDQNRDRPVSSISSPICFRPAVDFRTLVAACLKCVNVNRIDMLRIASSCCHRRRRYCCSPWLFTPVLLVRLLVFLITAILQRRSFINPPRLRHIS